jgi:hypothetical protein
MLKSVGDTIMQERFRMFCRAGSNFYKRDKITGRSESLGTADRTAAKQLLAACNQAAAQPQLNRKMAKAYLSAKSPDLLTRTWADVMEHYSASGVDSTRKRKATAFRSRPFALLRGITLIIIVIFCHDSDTERDIAHSVDGCLLQQRSCCGRCRFYVQLGNQGILRKFMN